MKNLFLSALVLLTVASGSTAATADVTFDTGSLRGRYTGHVVLSATIPTDGTNSIRIEANTLTALTFDARSAVTGASSFTVTIPGEGQFSCPFDVSGTYQIGESGLGSATLTFVSAADAACGGGGGVTLQMSLVVGGHNRRRLDVTVNGGTGIPDGEPLPLIGSGTLEKS